MRKNIEISCNFYSKRKIFGNPSPHPKSHPVGQRPFNNISNSTSFMTRLIEEFRSIDIFGRNVNQTFDLIPDKNSFEKLLKTYPPRSKYYKPT